MKKTKANLLFKSSLTVAGALFGLNACMYGPPPEDLPTPDVYGPPEYFENEDPNEPMQTDYGPPLIIDDDIDEPGEEVYGPPEWFDGDDTDEPIETVYGPPEWFSHNDEDDINQPMEPVYGPPPDEVIDDIDQPMGDVYGPPEMMNGEEP